MTDPTDDLRNRIADALREHHLSNDRDAADADGNAPCVCGGWREPGPMGGDDEDWDSHLADVALAAIRQTTLVASPDQSELQEDIARAVRTVLLHLGPNAIAMAQRGESIILNMSEAGEVARVALAAVRSSYVPPPPGSDRDKLPDDILSLIAPYMDEYVSTACETAQAAQEALEVGFDADPHVLTSWTSRMHSSCRLTRKQDMSPCVCPCHRHRSAV